MGFTKEVGFHSMIFVSSMETLILKFVILVTQDISETSVSELLKEPMIMQPEENATILLAEEI